MVMIDLFVVVLVFGIEIEIEVEIEVGCGGFHCIFCFLVFGIVWINIVYFRIFGVFIDKVIKWVLLEL